MTVTDIREGRENIRPQFVFHRVDIGGAHGMRCSRCPGTPPCPHREPDVAVAAVDELLRGAGTRTLDLSFAGGEPLLHPRLPEIVSGVLSRPVARLHLATDGVGLVRPEVARGLVSSGVTWVSVKLLGSEAKKHDGLCGRSGAFEATRRGTAGLLEVVREVGSRMLCSAEVEVCRHNLTDVPATVATAASWGLRGVRLDLGALECDPDTLEWVLSASDTGLTSGAWVYWDDARFERPRGQRVAGTSPVVWSGGEAR